MKEPKFKLKSLSQDNLLSGSLPADAVGGAGWDIMSLVG